VENSVPEPGQGAPGDKLRHLFRRRRLQAFTSCRCFSQARGGDRTLRDRPRIAPEIGRHGATFFGAGPMHQPMWVQAGDSLAVRYPQPPGAPSFIISDVPNFTNINLSGPSGPIFGDGIRLCTTEAFCTTERMAAQRDVAKAGRRCGRYNDGMSVLALDAPIGPTARVVFAVGIVLGVIGFGMDLWFGFRVRYKRALRPFQWIIVLIGLMLGEFGLVSCGALMKAGPDPPPKPTDLPAMRGSLISNRSLR
jgi:hypothetical protein